MGDTCQAPCRLWSQLEACSRLRKTMEIQDGGVLRGYCVPDWCFGTWFFFYILGIIITIDYIFQRGWNQLFRDVETTNQIYVDDFENCIKIRDPARMIWECWILLWRDVPGLWVHWYPKVDPYPPSSIVVETELAGEMRAVATAWRDLLEQQKTPWRCVEVWRLFLSLHWQVCVRLFYLFL